MQLFRYICFATFVSLAACGGGGGGSDAPIDRGGTPEAPEAPEAPEQPNPPTDRAPVAVIIAPATAPLGSTITLDGTGSNDPDGDVLTYEWSIIERPDSSGAQLSNINAARPTLTPDVAGSYTVALRVTTEGASHSVTTTINVVEGNVAPLANAGTDQSVLTSTLVTLDGSQSQDPDGFAIQFNWRIIDKPADSNAVLDSADSATPSFFADVAGRYELGLIVNDGIASSIEDTVVVEATQRNAVPVARAGNDQSVVTGTQVTLDGSLSSDANGDALSYQWTLVSAPTGSGITLENGNTVSSLFTPDVDGDYVFSLVVSDEVSSSLADTVLVSAARANAAPVANAGSDIAVNTNVRVQLDGTSSSDADGDALTYRWAFVSRPALSRAALNNTNSVAPDFVTDEPGSYVVSLVVNDGRVDSARATVTVTAVRAANPIPEGAGIIVRAGTVWHAYNGSTYEQYLASSSGTCGGVYAVDMRSDGKMIGVGRATAGMVEVDPFQPVCVASSFRWDDHYGLAIDKNDNYWVTSSDRLEHLSSTGEVISSVPYSGVTQRISGLDYASDGKLYGYSRYYGAGNNWVSIEPTTGITTLVANLPIALTGYDIDIDKNDIVRAISGKTLVEFDLAGNIISTRELTELCVSCGFNSVVTH